MVLRRPHLDTVEGKATFRNGGTHVENRQAHVSGARARSRACARSGEPGCGNLGEASSGSDRGLRHGCLEWQAALRRRTQAVRFSRGRGVLRSCREEVESPTGTAEARQRLHVLQGPLDRQAAPRLGSVLRCGVQSGDPLLAAPTRHAPRRDPRLDRSPGNRLGRRLLRGRAVERRRVQPRDEHVPHSSPLTARSRSASDRRLDGTRAPALRQRRQRRRARRGVQPGREFVATHQSVACAWRRGRVGRPRAACSRRRFERAVRVRLHAGHEPLAAARIVAVAAVRRVGRLDGTATPALERPNVTHGACLRPSLEHLVGDPSGAVQGTGRLGRRLDGTVADRLGRRDRDTRRHLNPAQVPARRSRVYSRDGLTRY
jgi:hypothetical protein